MTWVMLAAVVAGCGTSDGEAGGVRNAALPGSASSPVAAGDADSDGDYNDIVDVSTDICVARAAAGATFSNQLWLIVNNLDGAQVKGSEDEGVDPSAIEYLTSGGVVRGYDDDGETETFGPDDPLTRDQVAKMTTLAYELPDSQGEPWPFSDTDADWGTWTALVAPLAAILAQPPLSSAQAKSQKCDNKPNTSTPATEMCEYYDEFADALARATRPNKFDEKLSFCDSPQSAQVIASQIVATTERSDDKQPADPFAGDGIDLTCLMTVTIRTSPTYQGTESLEDMRERAAAILASTECCPTRQESVGPDGPLGPYLLATQVLLNANSVDLADCDDFRRGNDPVEFNPRRGELCRTIHGYAFLRSCRNWGLNPA